MTGLPVDDDETDWGRPRMAKSVVDLCVALFEPGGRWPMLSKEAFLRHRGLPDAKWRGERHPLRGWLELEDDPRVEVRFTDWDTTNGEGMPNRRKLRVGVAVLAAEELACRGFPVDVDLAAAAALALATGAVTVARKPRAP